MPRTAAAPPLPTRKPKPRAPTSWLRRNLLALVLLILALVGLAIALAVSLEPCKSSETTTDAFVELEAVFALDASGSFASSFVQAAAATAEFITEIKSSLNGELSVAFAQWNDPSGTRAGGGFHTFVPASDPTTQFPEMAAASSRVTSADVPAALSALKAITGVAGSAGGTNVAMPIFGCLELLGNSQRAQSLKTCIVFSDARWTNEDTDYSATPRFKALCDKHGVAPCSASAAKAYMEREGMLVLVGWLTSSSTGSCPDVAAGIEVSSCAAGSAAYDPQGCADPTPCTAGSDAQSSPGVYAGRCCPYWLELKDYEGLKKNAKTLAGQIGQIANARASSSVCVKDWSFLWCLLLFLPFLLYCCCRPLWLIARSPRKPRPALAVQPPAGGLPVRTATATPQGAPPLPRRKKKKGRWSVVETHHYIQPRTGGGAAPLPVDFGSELALPPSAKGMMLSRTKGNYHHFEDFMGVGAKDLYAGEGGAGAGGVERGDIDDYIIRCWLLCCCCCCCRCCKGRGAAAGPSAKKPAASAGDAPNGDGGDSACQA